MPMTEAEQTLYADIVNLVNRTNKPLEFKFDSKTYVIQAKGKKTMPRFIAIYGCEANPTGFDTSAFATGSLLGIEGDHNWPADDLTDKEVLDLSLSDKFGDEVIEGNKIIKKTRINLSVPKQTFQGNNL